MLFGMKELEPFSKEWLEIEIKESYPACIGSSKVRWRVYECWNWNDKPPLKRLNILWSLCLLYTSPSPRD